MNFVYFITLRENVGQAEVKGLGLEYAFQGTPSFATRECTAGPSGGPGMIIGLPDETGQVGYYPDKQTWAKHEFAGNDKRQVWIGFYTENPPTPAELALPEQVPGYTNALSDGNDWQIPKVRDYTTGSTSLPHAIGMGTDGQVIRELLPKYKKLYELGLKVWDVVEYENGMPRVTSEPATLTELEELQIATEALAMNYRVGHAELWALKLLTAENLKIILWLLVDVPELLHDLESKKNVSNNSEPPVEASNSGQQA